MRQIRYSEFLKYIRKFPHLTVSSGKGSEIKIFGKDASGIHRIHVMGCHGRDPTFSKHKILAFLTKFGIDPLDFFVN